MENTQKKVYEKPDFQVIELDFEAQLLAASPEQPTNSHSPAFYREHGFN